MTDGITISFGLKEKVTIFLFTIFGILSKHGMIPGENSRFKSLIDATDHHNQDINTWILGLWFLI